MKQFFEILKEFFKLKKEEIISFRKELLLIFLSIIVASILLLIIALTLLIIGTIHFLINPSILFLDLGGNYYEFLFCLGAMGFMKLFIIFIVVLINYYLLKWLRNNWKQAKINIKRRN